MLSFRLMTYPLKFNKSIISNSTRRLLGSESKSSLRRSRNGPITVSKSPTLKERLMAPAGGEAFSIGKGFLAGASFLGLGALCFYGAGLSNDVGAVDKMSLWSDETKRRIRSTYMYFGGSLVFVAATSVLCSRSITLMRFLTENSWKSILGTMGLMMGSGILVQSLPYEPGFGVKQLAWMAHSASIGFGISPFLLLGGPLIRQALLYTAGVVGGLSTLAICAPSDKFLNMGAPLAMGLGAVFVASIGSMFLPPTSRLGAGLYSLSVYGGLVLFSLFLLYDTQKIIKRAEAHYEGQHFHMYDPINNSVGIFMDTINIFMRILMILAGGGQRRK